jgi:hypothetical protein
LKNAYYTKDQEATRKNIERSFGVFSPDLNHFEFQMPMKFI